MVSKFSFPRHLCCFLSCFVDFGAVYLLWLNLYSLGLKTLNLEKCEPEREQAGGGWGWQGGRGGGGRRGNKGWGRGEMETGRAMSWFPTSVWGTLLFTPRRPSALGGGRDGWADFPSLTSGRSWPVTLICFEAQPQNSKCLTSLGDLSTLCRSECKFSGDCYLLSAPSPSAEQLRERRHSPSEAPGPRTISKVTK